MKIKTLVLGLLAALFFSTQISALTVVYIHGMSGDLTKQDAYDYWNADDHHSTSSAPKFVDISRNGHPYFITYRDGRQYLKPQTTQVVNQIYHSVQDTQIIIIAHSMGGLVTRFMMANPTNQGLSSYQRYQMDVVRNKVKKIITSATPHMGSPAADFVNVLRSNWITRQLVGWLGYDKDAIDHLTPNFVKGATATWLHPNYIRKSNGARVHMYMLGSRDGTAGEPWYNREFENYALGIIDSLVNYNSRQTTPTKGSWYDRFPSERKCVKRYWWGGCKTRKTVYGNGELDNDGMVSVWSGTFGGYANSYLHKYSSYDSHHTNRYYTSVAKWAKQFVY